MLDAVIFDIGNVLLHFDFAVAHRRLEPSCGRFDTSALAAVEQWKVLCESGGVSHGEFVERCMGELQFQGSAGEFTQIWQEIFTPNEQMMDFVRSLAGRYPLYLLSNTSGIHVEHFLEQYPVFGLFQGSVYSHEARLAKPDPAIFALARQQFGVVPERTAYIDDLADNVAGAQGEGFRAWHYDAREHNRFLLAMQDWMGEA